MTWDTLSKAPLDTVLAWAADQLWARAMAACRQDASWHAEGDVWTHTQMVCRELPRLDEWPELADRDRTVLLFTALFHDAAKPLTSIIDPLTGRVRSPNHAVRGEHLARAILRDLGCPLPLREDIARMVRYHGRPAFLLEKPDPTREVVMTSWWVSNRLLYLFALADTRGRDTEEMTRPEENLHLWKLAADEVNCFNEPYPFANDHARFLYFRNPEMNLTYVPHEAYRSRVTMMAGLPGSGKDTWLAHHRPGLPVVALDDIRGELDIDPADDQGSVIQLARERCREHLRAGSDFAFNATNLMRSTRTKWIDLFADYGARIELVYLEPSLATVFKQNKARGRQVPESVIQHLASRCEPPTWGEGHRLIPLEETS